MKPIRYRLALAALGLALATPVVAQETPAPAADQPATAAPATDTPPSTPEAGSPAAPSGTSPEGTAPAASSTSTAAPAEGSPAKPEVMEIVKDTYGDWQVRCAPDGNECFMYQLALDEAKSPVAEVSILKLPDGAEAVAGVTVVTPLGTLLTSGVVLQVDAGEKRQYPFAWCSQVGCFSRFGLAKTTVDGMKRGKAGTLTLISVGKPESPVTLKLSLSGFTAAFDSLQAPTAPAAPAAAAPIACTAALASALVRRMP